MSDLPPIEFEWPAGLSVEKPRKSNGAGPQDTTKFPIVWVQDAKLKLDARPIVKGMIEPGAFIVIYGPSGSGKSFFTADIAQHIATGQPWRGRKVQKGLVVYVASEAGASILKRFVGWRDNRMGESTERIPLAILTRGPDLMNPVQIALLCDQLAELQAEAGLPLVLVVFDTLSRSMQGADENSTEDMSMAVNVADYIRERFDAASAYVHHTGKDSSRGPRGAYALFAAADLVLLVQDKVASVEKIRDGLVAEKFQFTLDPIEIGRDADGDPVMTCLLNAADTGEPRAQRPKLITGRNQKIVIGPLRALANENNSRSPGTSITPKGALTLSMNDLIERTTPKFGSDDPAFRVREKIKDAVMSLQASGIVGVHGDLIWMLE